MAKRIILVTIGSRGDVQPFVALGTGLKTAGYEVTVATHQMFKEFVTSHGLRFAPIAGDPRVFSLMLASEKAGSGLLTFINQMNRWFNDFVDEVLDTLEDTIKGHDLLICGFLAIASICVAEKLKIPAIFWSNFPLFESTSAYPPVTSIFPRVNLPWFNRFQYMLEYASGYAQRPLINRWRTDTLGLPPYSWRQVFPFGTVNGQPLTKLFSYSQHILPRPDDYSPHTHVTGYWFLEDTSDWNPLDDLLAYLQAGSPPVYAGFGSLIANNADELINTIIEAVRASGHRLLLLSGWADYNLPESDDIFVIKEVSHEWLFPRMKAVVHHGGAGTTAAGIRAGVPSVIVPFFGDQVMWGELIHQRGIGPKPVPASEITVEKLTNAIRQATTSETIRQRAKTIGDLIRGEDGIGQAIRVVELLL